MPFLLQNPGESLILAGIAVFVLARLCPKDGHHAMFAVAIGRGAMALVYPYCGLLGAPWSRLEAIEIGDRLPLNLQRQRRVGVSTLIFASGTAVAGVMQPRDALRHAEE